MLAAQDVAARCKDAKLAKMWKAVCFFASVAVIRLWAERIIRVYPCVVAYPDRET